MTIYDAGDPIGSLRKAIRTTVERSPFSGLNFLFSDGDRLFAYRLGLFELHWLHRPGQLLVASERVTDEHWHTVQQDVLLVLDPDDLDAPHAERLVGDELLAAGARPEGRQAGTPARRGPRRSGRRARAGGSGRQLSRRFALLVNPVSAGGKALKALPAVARRAGPPARRPTGRSRRAAASTPPRRPRGRPRRARRSRRSSGDGMLRPLAGALKGTHAAAGDHPLRARQRPRARARDPHRPGRGRPRSPSTGPERLLDVANVDGTPFVGIASFGFDSDANRIANEAKLVKGNAVYLYAALRALAAWKPATLHA